LLAEFGNAPNVHLAKSRIARALEQVATRLGNTPTICRKSYVHPAILDAYLANTLKMPSAARARGKTRLSIQERALQKLLKRQEGENRLDRVRR
jgi:DNA topoisomerase-1